MSGDYVQCSGCKGLALRSPDQQGHPWGWFSISINTPKKGNKGYEWVGVYCSVECIKDDMTRIESIEASHDDNYDEPSFIGRQQPA
jgi:hypothetical protein